MVYNRALPWVWRAIGDGAHAGNGGIEGNGVATRKTAGSLKLGLLQMDMVSVLDLSPLWLTWAGGEWWWAYEYSG